MNRRSLLGMVVGFALAPFVKVFGKSEKGKEDREEKNGIGTPSNHPQDGCGEYIYILTGASKTTGVKRSCVVPKVWVSLFYSVSIVGNHHTVFEYRVRSFRQPEKVRVFSERQLLVVYVPDWNRKISYYEEELCHSLLDSSRYEILQITESDRTSIDV